jgi:hypothetical protein
MLVISELTEFSYVSAGPKWLWKPDSPPDQALVLDVLQASPGICVAVDGAE